MKDLIRNPWLRLLGLLAALAGLFLLLRALRHVLTPFAVAFALAYFLNPAVNALERLFEKGLSRSASGRHWMHPRAAAVGILTFAVVVVVAVVLLVAVPVITEQVVDTAKKLPDWARTLRDKAQPVIQRLNLRYPEQFEQAREKLQEMLREHPMQILSPVTLVLHAAFSSVLGLVLTVLHFIVIPVFTLYLLHDMNRIREGAKELVPHRYRDYVYSRVAAVDNLLSAFVRGQITVCLMLGTFYAIGLTLAHVPMGLLVGYVVAFFNMVPFMATVIGLPLVLLLKFVDDPSLNGLLTVAAIFVFGHFVESHFVTPRVVGQRLGLHAVVILLAVLVGGTLFGFIGMLVAVPTTAALSVFWADLREAYLSSEYYRGGSPPAPA
jgi:predicted PurR-regulated permease PerM